MRLVEIEDTQEEAIEQVLMTARQIREECQPYLSQVDNPLRLWRGVKLQTNPIVVKQRVRLSGRTPMDMRQDKHELINKYFVDRFGEPFRDAMFASGPEGSADNYGTTFLAVFPIGKFTFLWSPKISDLWTRLGTVTIPELKVRIKHAEYQTTDLQAAIDSGSEIMIRCKEYYGIDYDKMNRLPGRTNFRVMGILT